jgi:hypothetical protein
MVRVPVPDDYDGRQVIVAGREDYHYPEAEVQVDADHARNLHVREDEDGRYVGPPEQFADAVADSLGVTVDGEDSGTCDAVKSDGEVCGRELPCPYHGDEGGN